MIVQLPKTPTALTTPPKTPQERLSASQGPTTPGRRPKAALPPLNSQEPPQEPPQELPLWRLWLYGYVYVLLDKPWLFALWMLAIGMATSGMIMAVIELATP